MKKLVIQGGRTLSGNIHIGGAKNSVVALIPATVLTKGKCIIKNVPDISDVRILIKTLEYLGSSVEYKDETLIIDNGQLENKPIHEDLARQLRASYYFMGSLLGRFNEVNMSTPGGCVIGSRPIDFHLNAFKKMGVDIKEEKDMFHMKTKSLNSVDIFFDFPSVGATINIIIAAVLAKGRTKIINAAREPEIENVIEFLRSMGAHIEVEESSTIIIEGVKELKDGYIEVIPDRIEAGTYLIIGSLLGKKLTISDIIPEHIDSLIYKLKEAGVEMDINENSITVSKARKLKPVKIKTTVYPGFPTDLGQPMSTFLTQCDGVSLFVETIYENRLRHIPHLNKMGASIEIGTNEAIIKGKTELHGKQVTATDLRAGASMLVAGMIADGTTEIDNIEHLLRGYERIVHKLNNVGANIELIDE